MMQKPQTVTTIVLAACTLHNLLADENPAGMRQAADREDPVTHDQQPGEWRQQVQEEALQGIRRHPGNRGTVDGKQVREYLAGYYSGVGAVPWQNRILGL